MGVFFGRLLVPVLQKANDDASDYSILSINCPEYATAREQFAQNVEF